MNLPASMEFFSAESWQSPGLFFLYGTIANRLSDAAASVINQISTRNLLPVLVTVTLAFALPMGAPMAAAVLSNMVVP